MSNLQSNLADIIKEMIREILEGDEEYKRPKEYKTPEGNKRDKQLDVSKADLENGDPERVKRAYHGRERMEKAAGGNSGWKNDQRPDSKSVKKESIEETEFLKLIEVIVFDVLLEELSVKTKAMLRKKAKSRGLTTDSVAAEYKKGLAV